VPNKMCSQCGRFFPMPNKDWKLLDKVGPFVCSQNCMIGWIVTEGNESRLHPKHVRGHVVPEMADPDEAYSEMVEMSFRSYYEAGVAEALFVALVPFEYERHAFKVGSKMDSNAIYVPDFFIIGYNVFVEVKGKWGISGRTKVNKFRLRYPQYPLLVIPWVIREDFSGVPMVIGGNDD